MTLSVLVTGLESYTKRRFLELENEEIAPDVETLVSKFTSRKLKEKGILGILIEEAAEAKVSVLRRFVDSNFINFQNYENCKRAFNKAYGIRFGEIGLDGDTLASLQRYIEYRHRVVHVSPLLGLLNQRDVPREEPVFSNKRFAEQAASCFDRFITTLHEATLKLDRED